MRKKLLAGASGLAALLLIAGVSASLAASAPTATTGSATSVTNRSATVNGTVNPNGTQISYAFQYGTSTAYGQQTALTSAGSGTSNVPVSASLSNLPPGTTIHYRLFATNVAGQTSTGADATFTTTGSPPVQVMPAVVTSPATAIVAHGAQLNGTIQSSAAQTVTYHFEYGLTTAYGLQTAPKSLSVGPNAMPVGAALTGIEANTPYHYRLVAVTSSGLVATGTDQAFTTKSVVRKMPRSLSLIARSKIASKAVTVTDHGTLSLPKGVSRTDACHGVVSVQIRAGALTISNRPFALNGNCSYGESVKIVKSRLHGKRTLNLIARFRGNDVLKPIASRRVTVAA